MMPNTIESFLHALARFRSAQTPADLLIWNTRHPLEISQALHKAASSIANSKTEFVLFCDDNIVRHIAIRNTNTIVDILGANAATRFEESSFDDNTIKYMFVDSSQLLFSLNSHNFFPNYWNDNSNLSQQILNGILAAHIDYRL